MTRPVNFSNELIDRDLSLKIIGTAAPFVLLYAPQGYGKTALALQVYNEWVGDRFWVNSEHLIDFESGLKVLLDHMIYPVDLSRLSENGFHDMSELAILIADSLHQIEQPFLLVIDGIDKSHDPRLLKLGYELAQYLPTQHRVIITARSGSEKPCERANGRGNVQSFYATELRFSREEITRVIPVDWQRDSLCMQLVNSCEGCTFLFINMALIALSTSLH